MAFSYAVYKTLYPIDRCTCWSAISCQINGKGHCETALLARQHIFNSGIKYSVRDGADDADSRDLIFRRLSDDKAGGATDAESASVGSVFLNCGCVFLIAEAGSKCSHVGCKQNLGHPVNDLFDLKVNGQPQEASPSSVAAQPATVNASSAEERPQENGDDIRRLAPEAGDRGGSRAPYVWISLNIRLWWAKPASRKQHALGKCNSQMRFRSGYPCVEHAREWATAQDPSREMLATHR